MFCGICRGSFSHGKQRVSNERLHRSVSFVGSSSKGGEQLQQHHPDDNGLERDAMMLRGSSLFSTV